MPHRVARALLPGIAAALAAVVLAAAVIAGCVVGPPPADGIFVRNDDPVPYLVEWYPEGREIRDGATMAIEPGQVALLRRAPMTEGMYLALIDADPCAQLDVMNIAGRPWTVAIVDGGFAEPVAVVPPSAVTPPPRTHAFPDAALRVRRRAPAKLPPRRRPSQFGRKRPSRRRLAVRSSLVGSTTWRRPGRCAMKTQKSYATVAERPTEVAEAPGRAIPGAPAASPAQDVPIGPDAGIMAVMATTRAMRHLAPDPVPDELLRSVVEAATWAPSGGNKQGARYVIVTDRSVMARLAPLWGRAIDDFNLMLDAGGVRRGENPSSMRTLASIDYQRAHFAETPALIVVCEEPNAFGMTRGTIGTLRFLVRSVGIRRTIGLVRGFGRVRRSESAAIYPAVQNLLLAARAHGLAACLTTWHLLVEDEVKAVIGIPKDVRTWAIIPIGWPLRRFGPVRRRPVDEVIRRERW